MSAAITRFMASRRPSQQQLGIVLERCLPRFLDLFSELSVRATFFVIGRDLERDLKAEGRGAALLNKRWRMGMSLRTTAIHMPTIS